MVTKEVREDDVALEAMIRHAQRAPEPGDVRPGDVVNEDDLPTVIGNLSSAGYVYVWDTKTGERSIVNRNMLPAQLKKKRADGSFVFSLHQPSIKPYRGKEKCFLHPDNPQRQHYDTLGFPVCPKENLTSPFQVTQHMKHRHHSEWDTIEQERIDAEKATEREFQRSLISGMNARSPQLDIVEEAKRPYGRRKEK